MAVHRAAAELSDELGRTPTVSQIASRLELDDEEVSEALQADDARRQGADKLYSRGATQLTDLNVEWGLQKKQAPAQNGQTR